MRKFIFILSVFLLHTCLVGQNINMSNTTHTACTGFFFDSGGGGTGSPYSANENLTLILCPASGPFVSLNFFSFELGSGDTLRIYNGNTTAAPLIGTYTSATTTPGVVAATPGTNPTGCLTIVFTSDAAVQGNGWAAEISCIPPCQTFYAQLDSIYPDTTGPAGEFDICLGDTVRIIAGGNYTMNNTWYSQSNASSQFYWYLRNANGDTIMDTIAQMFEVPFDTSSGFIINLIVVDTNGCESVNPIERIVRVSTRPDFTQSSVLHDTICFGQTNVLTGIATSQAWTNYIPPFSGDSMFLPDATGSNPGVYTSNMTISSFPPSQTIASVNDIANIWLNMEHSFLGDLSISITCPNTTTVVLKQFPGGGGRWLGEPCDDPSPLPGNGYLYTWPSSTAPTFANMVVASGGVCPACVMVQDPCSFNFNQGMQANSYASLTPMSNLIGCPINGNWSVTIVDQWGADNGYLFGWGIDFDSNILPPTVISYNPGVDTTWWTGDSTILAHNGNSITVKPVVFDTLVEYTYNMTDLFGCSYDTTLSFFVRHPCNAVCLSNITPLLGSFPSACPNDSSGKAWATPIDSISPAPYTYFWMNSVGDTIRTALNLPFADTLFGVPNGTYTVAIQDSFGCVVNNTVNVAAIPEMQLTVVDTVRTSCFGNFCDGKARVLVMSGGTPPFSYLWNSTELSDTAIALCSGNQNVTVTESRGCSKTHNFTISQPDPIVSQAFGDDTICIGNTRTISASATGGNGGYTYNWNHGAGSGQSVSVSPNTTRLYRVVVSDSLNCPSDTSFVSMFVRQPLSSNVIKPDTICPGDTATVRVVASGGDGNYSYQWSSGINMGDSAWVNPPIPSYVFVTVTDACGTQPAKIDSVWVQVGGYPAITVIPSKDDTVCIGQPTTISANAIGGNGFYTFDWDNGLGISQFHAVAPSQTTVYNVTVSDNCLSPVGFGQVIITIGNFENFTFGVDTSEACQPARFVFFPDSVRPGFHYFWKFEGKYHQSASDSFSYAFDKVGCHDVSLMLTTPLGCVSEKKIDCMVRVRPKPLIDFDFDPPFPDIINSVVNFTAYTSHTNYLEWHILDSMVSNNSRFAYNFPDSGMYEITLYGENQYLCKDTASRFLTVNYKHAIWFPTAFTPNGDGINDTFAPVGEGIVNENYLMRIFDRWGKLVFETKSLRNAWDGKYQNGEEAANGMYVYHVEYQIFNGRQFFKQAEINLIR